MPIVCGFNSCDEDEAQWTATLPQWRLAVQCNFPALPFPHKFLKSVLEGWGQGETQTRFGEYRGWEEKASNLHCTAESHCVTVSLTIALRCPAALDFLLTLEGPKVQRAARTLSLGPLGMSQCSFFCFRFWIKITVQKKMTKLCSGQGYPRNHLLPPAHPPYVCISWCNLCTVAKSLRSLFLFNKLLARKTASNNAGLSEVVSPV